MSRLELREATLRLSIRDRLLLLQDIAGSLLWPWGNSMGPDLNLESDREPTLHPGATYWLPTG